jgi:hypothetical protein
MSEIKFACPVCGQHLTCDSAKSGTTLDCPTCFQKLIVPNAPQGDISKLVLNAALARPGASPLNGATGGAIVRRPSSTGKFPVAAIVLVVMVCAAVVAVFGFRETIFSRPPQPTTQTNAPAAKKADWTLSLAGVAIPDAPVSGRVNGLDFTNPRVQFQSDTLNFRVGAKAPPDLGLMIMFGKGINELAGRSFNFETNSGQSPRVLLRWKNDEGKSVGQYLLQGYALRLDFYPVYGNHLTGKIYFCATNAAKSYVAGTFDAEILKPAPPKPNAPQKWRQAR